MKAVVTKRDGSRIELAVAPPRLVPLEAIHLASEANRDVRQDHVTKIVKNFDPSLVQILTVNHRDGRLRLIDGQHRYLALCELDVGSVLCAVFEGLTDEQEANLFVALNRGRLAVNAWDLWKQELRAGHQDVVMIQHIVEEAGFRISRTAGSNHLQAVGALRRVFRLNGAFLLTQTMALVSRMWRIDPMALDGRVIEGVAIFLWSFDKEPVFDRAHLDAVLAVQPASSLIGKARALVRIKRTEDDAAGGLNASWISRAIVDFYNVGVRSPKRKLGDPISGDGRKMPARTTNNIRPPAPVHPA